MIVLVIDIVLVMLCKRVPDILSIFFTTSSVIGASKLTIRHN